MRSILREFGFVTIVLLSSACGSTTEATPDPAVASPSTGARAPLASASTAPQSTTSKVAPSSAVASETTAPKPVTSDSPPSSPPTSSPPKKGGVMRADSFPPPEPVPRLGEPCSEDKDGNVVIGCGTDKRVALVINRRFTVQHESGCALKKLKSDQQNGYETAACAEGSRVLAVSQCLMCRLSGSGWAIAADIDRLSAAQLLMMQKQMGFQTQTAMTTSALWRSEIASRTK
ncbi:MAG: hypothetical protein U0165_00440 [Polyangiaceae bacterium]